MLRILERDARGRAKPIPTDALRQQMRDQYGVMVVDRDMRHIRQELVAHLWPCYTGPHGYYYGLDAEDLFEAEAYLTKKIIPMQKERREMGYALEADQQRNELAPRRQLELAL